MAALITLRDISMYFGDAQILDHVNLTVAPGERICLVGRNGVGKSTLMNILAGRLTPDEGDVMLAQNLVVGYLDQEVPKDFHGTVMSVICHRLGPQGQHLDDYRRLCDEDDGGQAAAKKRLALQQTIDAENGWAIEQQVARTASQMNLNVDAEVGNFSAGMKRQVLLAAALCAQPDILLLDEPTNHLDMPAIDRLESFLLKFGGTLILISHDRMLIRRLATRILEIDRGDLFSWDGNYDTYLKQSQARLEAEANQNARFDKKLSAEEVWIRQGIKARRTRNEGRVRALARLRDIRRSRRDRMGRVRMSLEEAPRSGKIVIEATDLCFGFGQQDIVKNFNCTIMRGDRIGIIGPNGAGKSTLIRLLLKDLSPLKGRIKRGTNLNVRYFDQLRDQLDESKTVQQNISDSDMLDVGGKRRHVIGYLKDFLFSPQRSRTPVWVLSGGEKNRLLLAKLFSKPANVLVLDEPTNDLDVETLELLEELLLEFAGTVLLVSHDRAFINNVVTSTLVFEGSGRIQGYAGGYDDWLTQRPAPETNETPKRAEKKSIAPVRPAPDAPKKLGYMEKRELDALPGRIESLELRQEELFQVMSQPDFYRKESDHIAEVKSQLAQVEKELEQAFSRWEALESRDGG